jgi:hypothetical protein
MPIGIQVQRSITRNVVLSAKSQETVGEVFADASLTYLCRAETSGYAQLELGKESDLAYTSKNGLSAATESRLITQSSAFTLSTRLDDFLAGYLFAFLMGQETFTAGAPNTHLFTMKDTGDPAVMTNVYIEDGGGMKRKWSDMALTQLVLSGSDKGSITAKASFLGLGTVTADITNAMAALPALPTAQYLYGSDSTVSMGPIGALASMNPRVLSWEATFDHNCELFRATGGGVKPFFVRQGNPTHKLKLVIAAISSADIFDWMTAQTPLGITINVASGATTLLMTYLNVILPKSDLGEQDKYIAFTVDLDENSILQPAGGGAPVTVTVGNTDPAYLVGV